MSQTRYIFSTLGFICGHAELASIQIFLLMILIIKKCNIIMISNELWDELN